MPSLTDARGPRKPCPRGTAFTIVIISQNSPSLVGKSEPSYSQDRALACTRRTLSIGSNRGRRVLQVDDLHRTRVRLGRSRYCSLASHSRAAQPLALLLTRIALASGAAARVTAHSHHPRERLGRSRYCSLASHSRCLLYTSPSPRDRTRSRMPSSA